MRLRLVTARRHLDRQSMEFLVIQTAVWSGIALRRRVSKRANREALRRAIGSVEHALKQWRGHNLANIGSVLSWRLRVQYGGNHVTLLGGWRTRASSRRGWPTRRLSSSADLVLNH
jgi:hypothetical protein